MKSARVARWVVGAAVFGALIAVWLLLPLPPASDLYAARRWGVGAGYVGFVLGFPLGILAVPIVVGLRPYPNGQDASGAGTVAALVALVVATDWAVCAALLSVILDAIQLRRTHT
jgi:hypothetical protein